MRQKHGGGQAGQVSITGRVKGPPAGRTFIVSVPRKGSITVDVSRALIRHKSQFASVVDIKRGGFVQVTGRMAGDTLAATEVTILRMPGETVEKSINKGIKSTGTSGKPTPARK